MVVTIGEKINLVDSSVNYKRIITGRVVAYANMFGSSYAVKAVIGGIEHFCIGVPHSTEENILRLVVQKKLEGSIDDLLSFYGF